MPAAYSSKCGSVLRSPTGSAGGADRFSVSASASNSKMMTGRDPMKHSARCKLGVLAGMWQLRRDQYEAILHAALCATTQRRKLGAYKHRKGRSA